MQPGETRQVIAGIPGNTGVVYMLDRKSCEFLWGPNYGPLTNTMYMPEVPVVVEVLAAPSDLAEVASRAMVEFVVNLAVGDDGLRVLQVACVEVHNTGRRSSPAPQGNAG